ncbi:MAG: tripartite tricarboxylate transporter TctB family protein [Armatimonadetes bacterium]|nr:tripartite tricarboxylate transporter TctB family protein [Armatimonadota bacterium]
MRTADRLATLALLAFAAYVYAGARRMPYAEGGIPGPGFAPTWISVLMAAGALLTLMATRTSAPADCFLAGRAAAVRILSLGAAMVAAALLIPLLGMVTTLVLFILATVTVLGGRGWARITAAAVLVPLALLAVFQVWLKVPFPKGPLGF